ncbi:uncharacterized protein EV154DRAFT_500835 [Mucor mucedo]|uniref:Uncharacterized protein n=1 Tax=Mucor saturninus TaxID=64648 RepID=A0A8H7UPA6_9FUNG|nr:uncharacterized protein EV154DRAFT_500835 [Mucor mucedo]KAG2193491.1 hypothetical protein INT47_005016 [Mucor saturninus]KAI7893803.1 hypothetical protein EV154DRAFT_500835 [Mucor mucedo]
MQTNMYDDESQSIFVFRNPLRFLSRKGRQIGAYLSGGLLAIGWWVFIDAVINSARYNGSSKMGFEDWFSGILTTFGMIVINLIDKSRLQGEAFSYAGSGLVWKARLFLFLGFALIAGGFAGSCCVLIIKYIVHLDSAQPYINYGIAGVGQNGLIMLSTIVLWVAQNTREEYEYNMRI